MTKSTNTTGFSRKTVTADVGGTENEHVRITLPAPCWEGNDEVWLGVELRALFVSTRTKRCVAKTYSTWQHPRTHCIVGTLYTVLTDDDIIRYAGEYPEFEEALQAAGLDNPEEL